MQGAAHALDVVATWMPVLTVVALAKTALGAAGAALVVARHYYLDHLPPQGESEAAAAAVFDHLLHFLRVTLRTVIVLGAVVALGACGRRTTGVGSRSAPAAH
ncbi:hypothetical protein OH768_02700 [Streptomyces sp. NBC_01622]|uniref:hypothetical protein n=1 Tax=Streptomyces sp. NBC_01622 TaxID=2975903 RepID=UPI00386F16C8|nr:hypothetical protein OH768_02700 [Streptomyces sp. NBC_01622]